MLTPTWACKAIGIFKQDYTDLCSVFDSIHKTHHITALPVCFYVHKPNLDLPSVHPALLGAVW